MHRSDHARVQHWHVTTLSLVLIICRCILKVNEKQHINLLFLTVPQSTTPFFGAANIIIVVLCCFDMKSYRYP